MNSPRTPILHERSLDRASGYRILIYLRGLEAFVAISCSFCAQISPTSQHLLSASASRENIRTCVLFIESIEDSLVYASVPLMVSGFTEINLN